MHDYVACANFVASSVAADPIFASPRPPIAVLRATVAALGAVKKSARQALAVQVQRGLMTLKCYVQQVADDHPGEEAVIIVRAGMSVKHARGPSKPAFEAENLPVSGSVHLIVRAVKGRASYDCQYSTDEADWLFGAPTVRADATLHGLAYGTVYFFRHRTVTKEGVSGWSQVVSLLVA
jgi:hypothetical protein